MAGGRLVLMAGGSNAHNRITGNTFVALQNKLGKGPCLPFGPDFLVEITPAERFYPDVSVACGETRDFTDRPVLVVEVLSRTTKRFDLRVKLPAYLRKPGLAYVLYLAQNEMRAWLYRPTMQDGDEPAEFASADAEIALPELGITLGLAELYANVPFGEATIG
jgi:Uma2 family endonuclease